MQRASESTNRDIDPRAFLGVIRRRGWLVIIIVAVSAVGVFAWTSRQPKMYRSSASVRISNPSSENVFQNVGLSPVDPRRQVETETRILRSNDLREQVEGQLGADAQQIDVVQVTNPVNTDLLEIAVTSGSADVARRAADAYADVYVQQRKSSAAAELDRRATELRAEVDRLTDRIRQLDGQIDSHPGGSADPLRLQKATLENQQSSASTLAFQLGAQAALYNGAVAVTERAVLETEPFSPKPVRNTALAAMLALLLAGAAATLIDRLDDRITTSGDLREVSPDTSLLATLPLHSTRRSGRRSRRRAKLPSEGPRTLVPPSSAAAEAFRILRGNVRYSLLGGDRKVLMVTSPSGSEGKTFVTANLAAALAANDQRVVVVSADLRRPALAPMFGVDEERAGISAVLLGDAELESALVRVTIGDRVIQVLPAGPIPANPGELVGSVMMARLLARLHRIDADYVLVDSPPVLPVSDSQAMAEHVDGVIVVVASGQTRVHQLADACDRLENIGADILGFVLNGDPRSARRYGSYGYNHQTVDHREVGVPPRPAPVIAARPTGAPDLATGTPTVDLGDVVGRS